MYISQLSIRNYRNFKNVCLKFHEGVNTIIGENGSGKTNLFHAIRLLIDEDLPRVTKFYENDFNRSIGNWEGHWIIIQLQFSKLDSGDESQSIAMHKVGDAGGFDTSTGSCSIFFRPRIEFRRKLYELSEDPDKDLDKLNEILNDISLNDYESVFTGRGNVDFSEDAIYNAHVGNFETIEFPNPDDEQTDIYGVKIHGLSLSNEFACTFAKALRDVASDLRSYRDNPLLNLLRNKEKHISIDKKEEIERQVESLNTEISGLEEIQAVSQGISKNVKQAVGEVYAPNISIKSELPSEMERILQSLKLWVGDPDEEGYEGRIWELSLGGANLIYLSLKLLEFEKVQRENKVAYFILIEEPEAHLHTHIQKTLFRNLKKNNTQVFVSTHSTHISSASQISTMNILGRGKQQSYVYDPSNGLDPQEIRGLERYLDANRTNLLFAKGVLLVEGDAEQILIPTLFNGVFGVTLDELGISLINIGSTGFKNISSLFHDDRVRRKCSIITDNDLSIVSLPDNPDEDDDYQKKCRNSEKSGKERKSLLDEYCNNNSWLQPFYAKNTFEVDFLLAGNDYEIADTIKSLYKTKEKQDASIKLIKDKNVEVSAKEVLRLADYFKKGWFAIELSKNVSHLTEIPDYILNAVSFACSNLTSDIYAKMASYRVKSLIKETYTSDETNYLRIQEEMNKLESSFDKINYFKEQLTDDVLTKFIDL